LGNAIKEFSVRIGYQLLPGRKKGGAPPPSINTEVALKRDTAPGALKVLVVDDERDLADLAEMLLFSHGIDARVAYSAQGALDILEADHEINAVFSDIMMPGMTGIELANVITQRYPRIRVVLASGYTPTNIVEGKLAFHYVAKPYRIESVLKLLKTEPKLI
jgi:CheY-like chemotaxis protein